MSSRELAAIRNVVSKLKVLGIGLAFPHCSALQGPGCDGFWELRPRAGRSPWRPIFRRTEARLFVVYAVGPDAAVNKKRFRRSIIDARKRFDLEIRNGQD